MSEIVKKVVGHWNTMECRDKMVQNYFFDSVPIFIFFGILDRAPDRAKFWRFLVRNQFLSWPIPGQVRVQTGPVVHGSNTFFLLLRHELTFLFHIWIIFTSRDNTWTCSKLVQTTLTGYGYCNQTCFEKFHFKNVSKSASTFDLSLE